MPFPRARFPRRRSLATLAVAAATALLAPAAAAPASPESDPGVVENLGIPISTYLVLDTVLADDANGDPTLYGSTYNAPSDGVTFFGVDPETGAVRTELPMPGAWGGYHVTAGPDGHVYLGPLNSSSASQIWEYDPVADTIALVATMPTGIMCFGITVSPYTGKVYCGVHSGAGVYEYDPGTGAVRLVVSTRTYPKGLAVLDANRLVVAQGTDASVLVVDIATGAATEVLPSQYQHYSFAYNAVRISDWVYVQLVTPDARIVRFDAATMTFDAEVPGVTGMGFAPQGGADPNDFYVTGTGAGGTSIIAVDGDTLATTDTGTPPSFVSAARMWPVTIGGQQWFTSVGSNGLLGRWNPATGEVWTHQLSLPGNPTNITALVSGPDGSVYGGTYETNALFGYDPATGDTTVYGNVAPGRTGEILSMVTAGDKIFIGSYINNVVTVFDPAQPWNPGSSPASNPRDLGPVGDNQYRPWDMEVGPDGRVWVASSAAYGALRGALTAIDPVTYEVESFRGLAGDQHFFAVAAGDDVVYAGTTRYGDDTDAGGDARVLTVDPDDATVLASVVPVPGATRILTLETAADGTLYGSADGTWFRMDPASGVVTVLGAFPGGQLLGLVDGPGGDLYGHTGSAIVRIPAGTDTVEVVANPGSGYYRTLAFDGSDRAYWGSGGALLRVLPDVAAAPSSTTATTPLRPVSAGGPGVVTVRVDGPPGQPQGTVTLHQIRADGSPGAAVATGELRDGAAAVTVAASDVGRPGSHTLVATYAGSLAHAPSTSAPVRVVVGPSR
ncbi:Ig-like domain repeat protein [Jiangella endophytica]|uniref:Ig-like domain repeat protein n=1 Tax=Jiangella endophytica TaxID=1623398 RepID=UPI000E34CB07|nr:Ig-like domain repeat protein [Jiangella endophytica]